MKTCIGVLLFSVMACSITQAADIPSPGEKDPRIRYVKYDPDQVTTVIVRRGVATRILLGDDEQIQASAAGFPSNCRPGEEWCINATTGGNEVWVKPLPGATHNNIEIKTSKRQYSIEFKVASDAEGPKGRLLDEPMYRVVFRFAAEKKQVALSTLQAQEAIERSALEKNRVAAKLAEETPVPRNWDYTIQPVNGGDDMVPSAVFDDGRFTYLHFPGSREIPTPYYVDRAGVEGKANYHMDTGRELMVIERVSRRLLLRLGKAAVGIWNESYDPNGVRTDGQVITEGITRTLKVPENE